MKNASLRRPGRPADPTLADRRREEILDAAVKLFARHGFTETDTQILANKLQVGKGTLYRYFPSKEELFLAAVDRVMRQLQQSGGCGDCRCGRSAPAHRPGHAHVPDVRLEKPGLRRAADSGAGPVQGPQKADLFRVPRGQPGTVAGPVPRHDRPRPGAQHSRSSASPTSSAIWCTARCSPTTSTGRASRRRSRPRTFSTSCFRAS